jgi:PAS domain S-box-containing protein
MVSPTRHEVFFDKSELIVSKTDLKGRITYANDVFQQVAGYDEDELIGQPHSIIRHPDMPRCAFKLVWDTIQQGSEIFAYVVNMAKNGDHYWVLAHVTPSFDDDGNIVAYHSTRRVPDPDVVHDTIQPLYAQLKGIEDSAANRKDGMLAAYDKLVGILAEAKLDYDEFLAALSRA